MLRVLIVPVLSLIAQNAGLPYSHHLAGGIKGWKEAGLPTET